jgi:rod shape-determining protein MreC
LVYPRGASGIFPKGIPVGRIEKLIPVEGRPIWNVVVKFTQDYRSLQNVYVVKNLMQEEQKKLESNIPIEEKK